ncbi:rhodanese-like domain-containing protein [Bdellovibrio bacteriovorus]|uniref:rhodanese-like domain-containing protein n=1 Tax=Bdellovibrio bacteriovorus TaxID=959 RepID=UPI0021D0655A|nr:rhodanese-like domain-containing protein [Bdellovibrio bacteriovorus]UXR64137.1 rhodanese-like domain-containing protein [Bdellovibrio bacteriovorus]
MTVKYVNFESKTENPHYEGVYDIGPAELLNKKNDVVMIDVRQPEEYVGELGHVEGSSLMVLDTLPEQLGTLPKDKTVVFICRSGGRSAKATAFAKMNGFEEVFNMQGGMLLWNDLQLPTER